MSICLSLARSLALNAPLCSKSLNQESVACFTEALRAPDLSAITRKALSDEVIFYNERIGGIEEELYFGGLLPQAPSTKPLAPSKGTTARSSGSPGEGSANAAEGVCVSVRGSPARCVDLFLEKVCCGYEDDIRGGRGWLHLCSRTRRAYPPEFVLRFVLR